MSLPSEITDAFNLEACRGAIKFGDMLTKQICGQMIESLAQTTYPLYCAHGRPTILPLTNIFKNEVKNLILNF